MVPLALRHEADSLLKLCCPLPDVVDLLQRPCGVILWKGHLAIGTNFQDLATAFRLHWCIAGTWSHCPSGPWVRTGGPS